MKNHVYRSMRMAGGQTAVARLVNLTPQAVQYWCATELVPVEYVPLVVHAIRKRGHEFGRHDIERLNPVARELFDLVEAC
jgi:hypothetical protein